MIVEFKFRFAHSLWAGQSAAGLALAFSTSSSLASKKQEARSKKQEARRSLQEEVVCEKIPRHHNSAANEQQQQQLNSN